MELPVAPAIIRWGTLLKFFKYFHKVFFIRETAGICGFFYAEIIVCQKLFGGFNAEPVGIGNKRDSHVFFKQGGKVIGLITDGIRQFPH